MVPCFQALALRFDSVLASFSGPETMKVDIQSRRRPGIARVRRFLYSKATIVLHVVCEPSSLPTSGASADQPTEAPYNMILIFTRKMWRGPLGSVFWRAQEGNQDTFASCLSTDGALANALQFLDSRCTLARSVVLRVPVLCGIYAPVDSFIAKVIILLHDVPCLARPPSSTAP